MASGDQLKIDLSNIVSASQGVGDAGTALSDSLQALQATLTDLGEPWGRDDLGKAFTEGGYTEGSQGVLTAIGQLAKALQNIPVQAVQAAKVYQNSDSGPDNPIFQLPPPPGSAV